MGNGLASKMFGKNKKSVNLLIVGLYDSGKTTLLYKVAENVTIKIPTIGMTLEMAECKNIAITSTDIGGRCSMRPLLRHYYQMMDAVIFVVDSSGTDEFDYTRDQFEKMAIEEDLMDVPLLVLANKQDLPEAMSVQKIDEMLGVSKLRRQNNKRAMEILPASASTGEGVWDALEWIQYQVQLKHTHQAVVKPVQKAVPPRLASFYASVSSALKQTFGTMKETLRPSTSI